MVCAAFSAQVPACRPATSRPARCVVAQATNKNSRRDALLALGASVTLLAPQNAEAFLGIGEDIGKIYADDTTSVLKGVRRVLDMGPDEDKETAVNQLKKEMNAWTSKYRRDDRVAGRPSFSNTYSVVNALAGHWNSFGADAPVPKKRLARIVKELEDAEKLNGRGR